MGSGGDIDTQVVTVGDPAEEARASGNGAALPSVDGNGVGDSYLQFNVDDNQLVGGSPTSRILLEVDYFDVGTDSFSLQYDALPSGGSDGKFAGGGGISKGDTQTLQTAKFFLCDANFANRDNGADFRLTDNGDGAEIVQAVRVIGLAPEAAQSIQVDDFGANPFDDQPDSEAIQAVLDSACSGDTIVFTSGVNDTSYQGYLIDQTLFLTGMTAKHDLTFTASDPDNHALLQATAELKGFVVKLYARTRFNNAGAIDDLDFGYIDIDGNREMRNVFGPDGKADGQGDNWGSWLSAECTIPGDPWCNPGNMDFSGATGDWSNPAITYQAYPGSWTTGVVVHDLINRQTEAGTALGFGGAAGTIRNVTVDIAGDHVHDNPSCVSTDADTDGVGDWADGITLFGPANTVINNLVINPSDVGIVFFGGKDTVISNNTVRVTQGNYGAFAGIAIHPWISGDISGLELNGNEVVSEGDTNCGGLHAGINVGTHMWNVGFTNPAYKSAYGNSGPISSFSHEPLEAEVALCDGGACLIWAYLPAGGTLTMKDNTVTGAQINYAVVGIVLLGQFIDQNNASLTPQLSDWDAARKGCEGVTWGALDKVAYHPSLPDYSEVRVHCAR